MPIRTITIYIADLIKRYVDITIIIIIIIIYYLYCANIHMYIIDEFSFRMVGRGGGGGGHNNFLYVERVI